MYLYASYTVIIVILFLEKFKTEFLNFCNYFYFVKFLFIWLYVYLYLYVRSYTIPTSGGMTKNCLDKCPRQKLFGWVGMWVRVYMPYWAAFITEWLLGVTTFQYQCFRGRWVENNKNCSRPHWLQQYFKLLHDFCLTL